MHFALSKTLFSAALLTLGTATGLQAQLDIPLANVGLAYPGLSGVTIQLGGTSRSGIPTPFVIQGLVPDSLLWFCMDPLQTIYYSGSGKPAGSVLHYASDDTADFDKWTPLAPGLSAARIQNLADLFSAFAPTRTDQLIGGALQIAIWEIVNEFDGNAFNLSTGQMRVSGNATLLLTAQNMLDRLDDVGVQGRGEASFLSYLIDGSFQPSNSSAVLVQDLVGYTPVPESSSFMAGVAALLFPLALWRLRGNSRRAK